MAKVATVLGLMSGTSMDGIDVALLRTDGETALERLSGGFTPYPADVTALLRGVLGRHDRTDPQVIKAEALVTDLHTAAVKAFLKDQPVKPDLIGFHGQTIFHDPANGITAQIGDGAKLAAATGIDVVADFRTADIRGGGQGAPLLPLYHQALMRAAGFNGPVCVLNLGGVANITWMDGDTLIACDTGPANALIDDWMLAKTGTAMDKDGATAKKGTPDMARIKGWLDHPFFKAPAPKSLDRNAFAGCSADGLSLEDGAATLASFTVLSVMAALKLMPTLPQKLIVAGGGRHNAYVMDALLAHIPTVSADTLGWHGDTLEAEGFAYLAQRSVKGLPLSLPTTTGCNAPVTGGVFFKTHA